MAIKRYVAFVGLLVLLSVVGDSEHELLAQGPLTRLDAAACVNG